MTPKSQIQTPQAPVPSLIAQGLAASRVAVWRWHLDAEQWELSGLVSELLGLEEGVHSSDEVLAQLDERDRDRFLTELRSGLDTHQGKFHCMVRLDNGQHSRWLAFIGQPAGTPQVLAGLITEASEFVEEQEEHQRSERLLDFIFAASPVAMWVADHQGTLVKANSAFNILYELTPAQTEQHLGQYNLLRDPDIHNGDTEHLLQQAFDRGEPVTFEHSYNLGRLQQMRGVLSKNKWLQTTIIPVKDAQGAVVNAVVQQRDISEQRRRESALRERNRLLTSILGNTNAVITVKDLHSRYLLVNQEFARLFGGDPNQAEGKTDHDYFPPAVADRLRHFDNWMLEQGELLQLEETLPVGDEERCFVAARFPIKDMQGNLQAIGAIYTDITDRRAYETKVAEQRGELRLLLDSVRASIWYLDRWGMIKDCNQRALDVTGKTLTEALGHTLLEVAPQWDDPAERHREAMQVVRTGQSILGSVEVVNTPKGKRWLAVDKIPTKDTEGNVTGVMLVSTDISEVKHKEEELRNSDARYKAFIANSTEGIWRYDLEPPVDINLPHEEQVAAITENAVVAECNDALAQLYGYDGAKDLIGRRVIEIAGEQFAHDIDRFIDSDYRMVDMEIQRYDRYGVKHSMLVNGIGTVEDGYLVRGWGNVRDITERKRHLAELEYLANHDSLTLLPNRHYLLQTMRRELRQRPPNQQCALLLIDLDRFKDINDTLGHPVGDKLLKMIGPRLEMELAELPGTVARLGGDEFALFLSDVRNRKQALLIAHRVFDAIKQPFDLEGMKLEIGASIGVAMCPEQAEDVATLFRYADVAMYQAKSEMQPCAVYEAEFDPHSHRRLQLMTELGAALREEQFLLHFQPKVNLQQGSLVGFEALLRWQHPQHGFISPGQFIPLAEMSDIIRGITVWVLDNSLRQCRQWWDQGLRVSVAVNLSTRNLLDEKIVDQVERLLDKHELPPRALELEITESAIMADPARAERVLNGIHDLGVLLAIDDFGTGYSSLGYLRKLPVHSLKIDYSFVLNMLDSEHDGIIVRSTIGLAQNLGLTVVAEGVESQAILKALEDMGCDQAQGYHISRPVSVNEIARWLQESPWADGAA